MGIKITRTHLKPLQKKRQLKYLLSAEFVNCSIDDNGTLFSITFRLKNGYLQDIAIECVKNQKPCVLVSEPYYFDNAEIEVLNE